MGYDCPCGTSVGTRAHWCEWLQEQHAQRVEKLLALVVRSVSDPGRLTTCPLCAELLHDRDCPLAGVDSRTVE